MSHVVTTASSSNVRGSIVLHRDGAVLHLMLTGEIDAAAVEAADAEAALHDEPGLSTIDVHCADVSFIDSIGLSFLLRLRQVVDNVDGSVRLRHPSDALLRILDATGTSQMFVLDE